MSLSEQVMGSLIDVVCMFTVEFGLLCVGLCVSVVLADIDVAVGAVTTRSIGGVIEVSSAHFPGL